MSYVTEQEVRDIGVQFTETKIGTDILETVIERAARIFDLACGVDPEYFEAAASDAVATARTLYGNGLSRIRLPPYVSGSLSLVSYVNTVYAVPTFITDGEYLILTDSRGVRMSFPGQSTWFGGGWYLDEPLTVTAIWGYENTPEPVKAAVIELVINLVRETDPADVKLVNIEGQPLREKLPPRVADTARRYRMRGVAFV